ncbi:hypothetical protein ACFO0M_24415 [Micromonospora mangrovi]|uniref:EcsC family protein n=2 Tax=Micromonospora TaxID=1873 RepID=A0AAU8HD52_9ACTN
MQEQPPGDPARQESTGQARRSRSPKATFTPPPSPEPIVPPARQPAAEEPKATPPRRARPAPPVLFQPPEADQATAAPRRRPAGLAPTGEDRGTRSAPPATADPAAAGGLPERTTGPAEEAVGGEPGSGEGRKAARRAAPKKAAPAPRKRAARPAGEPTEAASELPHTGIGAGATEPTGPVTSTTARQVASTSTGADGTEAADPGTQQPATPAPAPAPAAETSPRKSATRDTTAKKAGPTARKAGATAPRASTAAKKAGTTAAKTGPSATRTGSTARKPAAVRKDPVTEAGVTTPTPPETVDQPVPRTPREEVAVPRDPVVEQPVTGTPEVEEPVARTPQVEVAGPCTPGVGLRAVRARVLDHPGLAPELLALAAVEALGPRAREWAERLRETYPDADADGLARLAARRFVRLAGAGGAVSAVAGLFAPVAELASVLWTQAGLVLHLAAAYGHDPAHPDRAVELLVLTRVHPDADSAREALAAARSADGAGEPSWPRAAEAARRLAVPLAAQAGGWLGLRLASRLLPGAAVLAAAAGNAAAAERLAARAVGHYRPARVR